LPSFIDASALETLEGLGQELRAAGVEFHLAEIKGRLWTGSKLSALWTKSAQIISIKALTTL
jgi:SulP family sulfate permease